MDKIDILSMIPEELEILCKDWNVPKFRAGQIFGWLHEKLAGFDEMTNLPKDFRVRLEGEAHVVKAEIVEKLMSGDKSTIKYLFELEKGLIIEAVRMEYSYGSVVCLASQSGCGMNCVFCASGLHGLHRNLKPSEILALAYGIIKDSGPISNIVLMGSGEPLLNYDNVMRFITLVNHPKGQNIGKRHIALSTCGIIPGIKRLIDDGLPIRLAISLHAPNDGIRNGLMPISKTYPLSELMAVCREYVNKLGRITFEYALIDGVNDQITHAKELSKLLGGIDALVNLIPLNPTGGPLTPSPKEQVKAFHEELSKRGVNATIRREMGGDIAGACGQLKATFINSKKC